MSDWPAVYAPAGVTLHTLSPESQVSGALLIANGSWTVAASGVWVAQRVVYLPCWLGSRITVTQLWVANGATAAGNLDVGIYDRAGTLLVSKGATAQAGISAAQTLDVTDTTLGPGPFYLAFWSDSSSTTVQRWTPTTALRLCFSGVWEQTGQTSLPATATFAQPTVTSIPLIGLHTRALF